MSDDALVAAQIERDPRAPADVVRRCSLGLPVVVRMPAQLPSGEPFPTRYWLTCPLATRRIARLEAAGAVARFDERVAADEAFRASLLAAHRRASAERGDPEGAPFRGVAGSRAGVKCLHAHFAHHVGAGDSPVGAAIVDDVEPLECASPCVELCETGARRAPGWREPSR